MESLLIIASGTSLYREYVFRSIATEYELVLLHDYPITWQKPYIIDYVQVPLFESALVITVAQQLALRYHFVGVFTHDEASVELVAVVAEALMLPHNTLESMHRCRDKFLMRRAWEAAGIPSAINRLVASPDEASAAATAIGYPVVVKPRALSASIGVVKIDNPRDIATGYHIAEMAHPLHQRGGTKGVLVEEYLEGPEVSVESVVFDDQVYIVAITRKQTGPEPYFEEVGHVVSLNEPLTLDTEIRKLAIAAHLALGIHMGVTHAEIRLTSRGPRMIELGARLAGDFIPRLVFLATGLDLMVIGASISAGKLPVLKTTRHQAAAVHFVYPEQDTKVVSLTVEPSITDLPWLVEVIWLAALGEEVRLPPRDYLSRLVGIIVSGDNCAECSQRIHQVLNSLRIELKGSVRVQQEA